MKFNSIFTEFIKCSDEDEVFKYLKDNLINSITVWEYFVNWQKVIKNIQKVEINLNLLNYLIGKNNVEEELRIILEQYPSVVSAIPILLACRNHTFEILTNYLDNDFTYQYLNLSSKNSLNSQEINKIIEFCQNTGLFELLKSRRIKNLPDYVLGIEVGLESNARKNRSGTMMEKIVGNILQKMCKNYTLQLMLQATSVKLKQEWKIDIKLDKSSRRFDFAVMNNNTLYLIETNFYGGGGSKLKATAGEYKTLFDFITSQGYKFIWITDGLGWKSTLRPLEETFNYIDYTFNLKMVSTGLLAEIILQEL